MAVRYVENRSEILNRVNLEPAKLASSYARTTLEQNIDKSKYFSILTSQMSEIVYIGINL